MNHQIMKSLTFFRSVAFIAILFVTACGTDQEDGNNILPVSASSSEQRISKTGNVFVLDRSIPTFLGKVYRDEAGLVWGDVAKNKDGSILYMNHEDATAYCKKLNKASPKLEIRLPTLKELIRLRNNLGSEIGNELYMVAKGYSPKDKSGKEILSNLSKAGWSWSSAVYSDTAASIFNGRDGHISYSSRNYGFNAVRCVASRRSRLSF